MNLLTSHIYWNIGLFKGMFQFIFTLNVLYLSSISNLHFMITQDPLRASIFFGRLMLEFLQQTPTTHTWWKTLF